MGVWDENYNINILKYDMLKAFYSILYIELAKMYGKINVPEYVCNYLSDEDVRVFYTFEKDSMPDKGTIANLFKAKVADKNALVDDDVKEDNSIENLYHNKFNNKSCSSIEGLNYCLKILYENGKLSYTASQRMLRDVTNICALDYIVGTDKRVLEGIPISIDANKKDAKVLPLITDRKLFTYDVGITPLFKFNTGTSYIDTLLRFKKKVNIYEFEENFDKAIEFYSENLDSTRLYNMINEIAYENEFKLSNELIENIMDSFMKKSEEVKKYIRFEK